MLHQPFFVPSVILGLLAMPLVFRWIPKNRIYGIRTKKTLADESAWYAINQTGGVLFFISSAVYFVVAWQLPMSGQHDPRFGLWLCHLAAFVLPIVLSVIWLKGFSKRHDQAKK